MDLREILADAILASLPRDEALAHLEDLAEIEAEAANRRADPLPRTW
jgi:hypothetical protein